MKYKIIQTISYPLIPMADKTYEELKAQRFLRICKQEDDIIRECSDADAIIVSGMTPVKKRVIERLDRCRIIAVRGSGYQVDLEAATDKAICVVNVPDYCSDEVSDHAMALILACARKIMQLSVAVKKGQWDSYLKERIRQQIWPGIAKLRGKTLGLIGFGNIARYMVPKAKAFGMNIIAYSRHITPSESNISDVSFLDIDEVVESADFISLHCSLTDETHHLFNQDLISKMKPTAYIINTARGQLIDEKALYEALTSGKIAGAGLDVLEQEDPPDTSNPLLQLPQVILTAHSAHYSDTSAEILKRRPDEAICQLLSGRWPEGLVNEEVKLNYEKRWGDLTA